MGVAARVCKHNSSFDACSRVLSALRSCRCVRVHFSYSLVYVREPTSNVSVRLIVSASALLCPHELGFRIGAGGHGTGNV